jgi:hypothetical protein
VNIQSHIVDLPTSTGVMRTYVHRPAGKMPILQFYFTQRYSNKLAQSNALPLYGWPWLCGTCARSIPRTQPNWHGAWLR